MLLKVYTEGSSKMFSGWHLWLNIDLFVPLTNHKGRNQHKPAVLPPTPSLFLSWLLIPHWPKKFCKPSLGHETQSLAFKSVHHISDSGYEVLILLWVSHNNTMQPIHVGIDSFHCRCFSTTWQWDSSKAGCECLP